MKASLGNTEIIIGKRVTVGAAINGIAAALAHIYPDQAPAIISFAVPITLMVQLVIVNRWGVTT